MRTDCGCGCGGTSARPSAFVRPRFFAGQLLTEDDLGLLVDYMTGKSRLHNRSMFGPGVVCGLEVGCDPCGGGKVVVHPGHALDCTGNDIVLNCKEQVDVQALVRELRVSSLGVDCGDPCDDDGRRRYGLFVRYEELSVEPVAPYATEEPCPSPGCVPSRIREGFRFVVKCDDGEDHRHNPGTRLLARLGDPRKYSPVRDRSRRFEFYADAILYATLGSSRTFKFDATEAKQYKDSLEWLRKSGEGTPDPLAAPEITEHVRALAGAIARFDTHDTDGQKKLLSDYSVLDSVSAARTELERACGRLTGVDAKKAWPDPLLRSIAGAVVTETQARVVPDGGDRSAPIEARLVAQGTPMNQALKVEFCSDLSQIREWLLGRLERTSALADCSLRAAIAQINVPHLLPPPEPGSDQRLEIAESQQIGEAAARLIIAVRRFVTDAACSTLNPPCSCCTDTDVLLAHLELDDCDVVRICSATREQVLPGGSQYGEWLPKLYRLRELAERLCCQPVPEFKAPSLPGNEPVPGKHYDDSLLRRWPQTGDLAAMLRLLLRPAPGETPPKALHDQVYTTPSEVTDSLHELAALRTQVTELTAALEGLRAQLGSAQAQVTEVREQLPERLGSRLEQLEGAEEPESAKPARRTRSTRTPKSGEST
ncbi:hypothetical protein JOF56_010778 [Kibdelosporangium banguiense]|uniref:Uncharacterized protein n=1 Tax=Kibdelosporangium banguiense TaxID=1365924 RepID=A0ABS4U166_9PSEU|nr:hypothetical protein [Kibdelosporangium banguiense]MBP2330393.1 hypothetical protein [Kibdelosporangium banguiense]